MSGVFLSVCLFGEIFVKIRSLVLNEVAEIYLWTKKLIKLWKSSTSGPRDGSGFCIRTVDPYTLDLNWIYLHSALSECSC